MTNSNNNLQITRTTIKESGHLPSVSISMDRGNGRFTSDPTVSRLLTTTTAESRDGVLTQQESGLDCTFCRGTARVTVTLPPLHNGQTNSEWFAALDNRIAIVQQAFIDLLPGEHNETYTKEYSI